MDCVSGKRLDHNEKLNGVIRIAKIVTIEVNVMDSAVFPLPRCTAKFETFPPGQEAIMINPRATLGMGPQILISTMVRRGRIINCEESPTATDLGIPGLCENLKPSCPKQSRT